MNDPFNKAREFVHGKMTERPTPGGEVVSPPSIPGDPLKNRKGDLGLAAVTNNEPSLPVDSDANPTLATLFLDPSGRLRILLPPNLKITGTMISGTTTQTINLTISQ